MRRETQASGRGRRSFAVGLAGVTAATAFTVATATGAGAAGGRTSAAPRLGYADTVAVIDSATNTVAHRVTVGAGANAVAYDPDNGDLYVSDYASDAVSVIDGTTDRIVATLGVGTSPDALAYDPLDHDVYVAESGNTLTVIDAATNTVTGTVTVGRGPFAVAYDAADQDIYVTNNTDSSVSVLDGATGAVVATDKVAALVQPVPSTRRRATSGSPVRATPRP